MTLVATNVAARGLDINDVQLIIQVLLMYKRAMYQIILISVTTWNVDIYILM